MKKAFSSTLFQIVCLVVLIVVFWAPIMFDNEFFYDDYSFIDTFKAGTPSIGYFLKPHNEHFMPMFKGVFFSMYKIFGANIVPYMGLVIIMHVINAILIFFLLKLIFDKKKFLPFLLTLFFALNTTYYEILHWFVNTSQAIMFFFLLLTLLLFHLSERNGNKKSVFFSRTWDIACLFFHIQQGLQFC
ncbi:hypothetical protein HZC34_00240 [Candidatus Saganbacteria bacterium]|nr:hypothetical protein [Candidatus Saganbacteria bacterium]